MSQISNNGSSGGGTTIVGSGSFILGSGPFQLVTNSVNFIPMFAHQGVGPDSLSIFVVPADCVFDNLYVNVTSNNINMPSTIYLRVNQVNTALNLTVPAGGFTGVITNLVNTVSVSAGDVIDWKPDAVGSGEVVGSISMRGTSVAASSAVLQLEPDSGGTVTPNGAGTIFVDGINGITTIGNSNPNTIDISFEGSIASTLVETIHLLNQGGAGVAYHGFYTGGSSIESEVQMILPYDGIIDRLYVYVTINNMTTGTQPITLRVNGVDTALTLTIPSVTTGSFTNLVDSVSVSAGDLLSIICPDPLEGDSTATISVRFAADL